MNLQGEEQMKSQCKLRLGSNLPLLIVCLFSRPLHVLHSPLTSHSPPLPYLSSPPHFSHPSSPPSPLYLFTLYMSHTPSPFSSPPPPPPPSLYMSYTPSPLPLLPPPPSPSLQVRQGCQIGQAILSHSGHTQGDLSRIPWTQWSAGIDQ